LFLRILLIVCVDGKKLRKNFSVFGDNGERISPLLAKTVKGIQRIRQKRPKNFTVVGENGEMISA